MNTIINDCLVALNEIGRSFCSYAGDVFIQSSVLIVLLLIVDFLLRKRVRAVFRYWIWMLVFVKLILPPTLSLPTGVGYWFGDYLSASSVLPQTTTVVQEESTTTPIIQDVPEISDASLSHKIAEYSGTAKSQEVPKPAEIPNIQPSQAKVETATPVLPDRAALNPITWQAVAFGFWLVGVLVISVLLIQRILFVRGLIAQGEEAGGNLAEMMNQCRQKVGVSRNIEVRLSNTVLSPAVCGLFRPIVLIPKSLLDTLSPDNLRTVLVHELAHIKRGDLWINCMQTVLQIIYFYNPFVWLANAVVRKIREQAVDEMVLVALGSEAKSYSNTLIDIAEIAFFRASLSLRLIGVVESKKELNRRIRHMLNRPVPKSAKIGLWGLFVVTVMGAILLPMAKAQVGKESKIAGVEEQFTETLPQNVTVRLAGVCDWPEEGRRCWRPDGSQLPEKIYASKWNVKPGFGDYGFMFEVSGPDGLNFKCHKIDGASGSEGSCKVVDEKDNQFEGYVATISDMEEGRLITQVRAGVAAGPWTTIASHDGKKMKSGWREGVLWSQAFQSENSISIIATRKWRKNQQERIVAIDKEGELHTAGNHGSVASGEVDQFTASFRNLKLEQIEKFLYQIRPYQWVTFNNVSLKPGAITPVQVATSATHDMREEHKPLFTSTLSNGATVELVGVSRNPTQGEQWWRPDGSLLAKPPYHSRGGSVIIEDDDEYKAYQFVARLKGVSREDVKWRIPGGSRGAYTGRPMDKTGRSISDLRAYAANQPRGKNSTVVRIGIAAGEWETVATNDSKKEETYGVDGGSVSFGVPYEKDSKSYLPVTYTKEGFKDKSIRVFAIEHDGNSHIGSISGSGGNVLSSMTYDFRLSLEDIKEFQFKTRLYQWVTFDNVSLKPNVKTDVQVEVKCVPAAMVGTWFFDNPQGDEEQMAIFSDGRVVVLYSNGHKDQSNCLDGFIELAEYGNARCKMVVQEDGALVQYFTHSEGEKFGKRWKRIDPIPRASLLRPLAGQDMSTSEPALVFETVDGRVKAKLLNQMEGMTKDMIQAFNEGNVGVLLSHFTDDAIVLPDQQEAAIGRDALLKYYLQQIAQQAKIRSIKDFERQIWICGDYVFEVSNFVVSITSPGSRYVLSDLQKNLAVCRKQPDGSLKLKLTASNPMPVPGDGNMPEAVGPDTIKVVSSLRPSNLPPNVSGQIRKDEDIFHKKFLERDAEGAVDFYAENAVLLPWGKDAIQGKSEILKSIKRSMEEEPLVDITQKIVHVEGNNQMLFVVNMFSWTFKEASSGENITLPGKGVHVWTRQKDGSWKILFDLHNVSVPIPGR